MSTQGDGNSGPKTAEESGHLVPFLPNLLAWVLGGLLASGWVLYFTDWFPVIGGLLGLGGLFAWFAFLSNVLPEDRTKQLQKLFSKWALESRLGWAPPGAILAAVAITSSFHGTIVVDSQTDPGHREVEFAPVRGGGNSTGWSNVSVITAEPHSTKKVLVSTPLFGSAEIEIAAIGLPRTIVTVDWFRRTTVKIPATFDAQAALLVRPSTGLLFDIDKNPVYLEWEKRSGESTKHGWPKQYKGESYWVGCDDSVSIPESSLNRWPLLEHYDLIRTRWTAPLVLDKTLLKTGDQLRFTVFNYDDVRREKRNVLAEREITIGVDVTPPYPVEVEIYDVSSN